MVIARPVVVLALSALAMTGWAGSAEVQYVAVPAWVKPAPAPTATPTPADAPVRIVHSDNQVFLGPNGDELFTSVRLKLLTAEALRAGNITVVWNPDSGDVRVHYVRIIRDGKTIDVLKDSRFEVLRREGFLENDALNGQLTAMLQVPGLEVGDELEFAQTVRNKDLTLGEHSFGLGALPPNAQPGAFRIRLLWPAGKKIRWQATPDVPTLRVVEQSGNKELTYELRDPTMSVLTNGAPPRFNIRRLIEYSDFADWREVSARITSLFDKASVLAKDSPVHKEVARIAASSNDPTARIEAALQLVQDRIRYVYIGFNGGNFTPATVDTTWTRRFGDCKAKTVLLLALLRELGIQSEAVLVNTQGGDGLNQRLPSPGLFDHVLVRATVGQNTYWLDGTRLGDRSLASLPMLLSRWALPLRKGGAEIEEVAVRPPTAPYSVTVAEYDASAGVDAKARAKVQNIIRGDAALEIRAQLRAVSKEDGDRMLRRYWNETANFIEPESVSWKFAEREGVLQLLVTGQARLDWEGSVGKKNLTLPGAGFSPPPEYRRPQGEDQSAPWAQEFPVFRCWATAVRLPTAPGMRWDYSSMPVNRSFGGTTYWRVADFRDNTIRTVMSKRSDTPEITAAQAEQVNSTISTFDNKMSQVFQLGSNQARKVHPVLGAPPFTESTDWMSERTPCDPAGRPVPALLQR